MRACSHCFTLKYGCFKVRGMRIYIPTPFHIKELIYHYIISHKWYAIINIYIYTYSLIHSSNMMERRCIEKNERDLHSYVSIDTMAPTKSPDPKTSCTRKCCSCCGSWYSRVIHPNAIWTNIFTDKKKWGSKLIQVFVHQLSDENEDQLLDTLKKSVSFVIQINISTVTDRIMEKKKDYIWQVGRGLRKSEIGLTDADVFP